MSDVVIRAENLGKKYRIRHQRESQRYSTLRDAVTDKLLSPWRRLSTPQSSIPESQSEDFWALKDVSFDIKQGEVVGIIGRNGAGKSTLLKILSRITTPTNGRVGIKGRVASLLEVGTGFHGELTGRENIYLNGAILGMSREEIKHKFDEIVAFAEIEKFLDTPVKRYSSGMYVRLAFAVAAHMEPEILVVDEVLAVGDADFQKKCLGKMGEVAMTDGRTIIFVSHNMQAVQALCQYGMLMHQGSIIYQDVIGAVANQYLSQSATQDAEKVWQSHEAPGNEAFQLLAVRVLSPDGTTQSVLSTQSDVWVEMEFSVSGPVPPALCIGFDLMTSDSSTVLRTYQTDARHEDWPEIHPGSNRIACRIPAGLLNGGVFDICPRIGIHNVNWYVHLDGVVRFELILDHGVSPLWNSLTAKSRSGMIAPVLSWTRQPLLVI
ncbi:MAG: polysaccharide ABC transporter ATP-binding protein [Acidobacteriota bacterium]